MAQVNEIPECIDCLHCGVQPVPAGPMFALAEYCEEGSETFPHKCNKYDYEPGADKAELIESE